MQFKRMDKDYFIYLEKDEKIMDTLTKFCHQQGIQNARVSGIGAVKSIEIGAYDTMDKDYVRQQVSGTWELVSLEGNVTLKDGKPFVHAHVVLSDHDMNTKGGHLFDATVAAVGECFLTKFDHNANRELNEDVGLPCICLENRFEAKT